MFVRGVGVLGILMTLTIFGYAVVLVLIIIGLVAIVFIALVD
jgi:hypothetical protein